MSDIFISYARTDRPQAQRLAEAFKRQGWSVWWDREIQLGTGFRRRIAEELTSARCVVVLWSAQSVVSDWVQDEANDGKDRDILIPISIEKSVRPPLGLRGIQSAELFDWDGTPMTPAFREILADIEAVLRRPTSGPDPPPHRRSPDKPASVQFEAIDIAVHDALGKSSGEALTEDDWTNLRELDLGYADIGDAGLRHLAGRIGLEHLDLSGNAISDAGLKHLSSLSRLRYLDLSHNATIGNAGLGLLAAMPRLEHLNLSDTAVTLGGLRLLAGLGDLQDLLLRGVRVTAEDLPALAALTTLRRLDLGHTAIDDAALPLLQSLVHLEYLGLRQTGISDNGKDRLKHILVHCRVLG